MGGYPPGAENDPRAPYNQDPPMECELCGGTMREDGHEMVDGDPCENDGYTEWEYEEDQKAMFAEMKMDEMRLNGEL